MTSELIIGPRLTELERVIERGKKAFLEVGAALLEIRERRLYKEREFRSFNEYVVEHLGFKRAYADHLVRGAKAVAELHTTVGTIPANEGQARELARAPKGERAETWAKVVEAGEPITAAKVREIVDGQKPAPTKPTATAAIVLDHELLETVKAAAADAYRGGYTLLEIQQAIAEAIGLAA